jgi:WD40 repeat protein
MHSTTACSLAICSPWCEHRSMWNPVSSVGSFDSTIPCFCAGPEVHKLVVSGCRNGAVYVWNSTSRQCLMSLSGASDAVWGIRTSPVRPNTSDPASRMVRVLLFSRDNKVRKYNIKLESLERASHKPHGHALTVKADHVLNAHRMPILCMDCCTVPENSSASGSSVGGHEGCVDIVALGSAGARTSIFPRLFPERLAQTNLFTSEV